MRVIMQQHTEQCLDLTSQKRISTCGVGLHCWQRCEGHGQRHTAEVGAYPAFGDACGLAHEGGAGLAQQLRCLGPCEPFQPPPSATAATSTRLYVKETHVKRYGSEEAVKLWEKFELERLKSATSIETTSSKGSIKATSPKMPSERGHSRRKARSKPGAEREGRRDRGGVAIIANKPMFSMPMSKFSSRQHVETRARGRTRVPVHHYPTFRLHPRSP